MQQWPTPAQVHGSNKAGCLVGGVIAGVVVMGVAGAMVFGVMARRPSYTPTPYSPTAPMTAAAPAQLKVNTFIDEDPCLVDANGDGTPDPVGRISANGGLGVAAVDGAKGKVLWNQAMDSFKLKTVWCGGKNAVFLEGEGFMVEKLDVKTGKVAWTAKLPDTLDEIGVASDCVRFKTSDGAASNLSLSAGASAGACKPATMEKRPDLEQRKMREDGIPVGDIKVKLTRSYKGTARYQLTASRKGKQLWQKVFDISSAMIEEVGAATSDGILLVGTRTGQDMTVVYTVVKAETGDTVWTMETKRTNRASGAGAVVEGKHAFIVYDGGLDAIDLGNGAQKWRLGGYGTW